MTWATVLVLFTGFWSAVITPTSRQLPGSCEAGGAPYAAGTTMQLRAHLGSDLVNGSDYDLGTCAPGDTVVRLVSAPTGSFLWFVSCTADSGRTWSCWSSDSVVCGVVQLPGDLNGDGAVNTVDLGLFALAQRNTPVLAFPK